MEYEVSTIDEFDQWLEGQSADVQEMVATRITRIEAGLLGDHAPVGDTVSEFRDHRGPGYRLYYTLRERVIVILLWGGIKKTQKRDIKKAKALAALL
jgi:putative addiction module killer protein